MWGYGRKILLSNDNVSVVIPALNEPKLGCFLVKLKDYGVDVRTEKGLSYAVWRGIQESKSEVIVVLDGDGSHPIEAIPKMINCLDEENWLVVGSRYCRGGYSDDSVLRKIVSLIYCSIARIMLRTKIRDPMSGFWIGYREAFNFKPSKTYKFGLQLIRKHKKHIVEYPIIFEKRKSGKSHVKPLQAIKDLLAIFCV